MLKNIIKRPIAVSMIFLCILLLGLVSLQKIPLELKPNTEFPALNIIAYWHNASPETIEREVSSPIESEISSLLNIHKIKSYSRNGRCYITVEYNRGTNMNLAYMNLNEKIQLIKKNLPKEVRKSLGIKKYVPRDLRTSSSLLEFKIFSDRKLYEVYQYAIDYVKPKILFIEGVSGVEVTGSSGRVIKVLIDRKKAEKYGLYPQYIMRKIAQYGKENDIGIASINLNQFNLVSNSKFKSTADFGKILIAKNNNIPIRLGQIATIKDDLAENMSLNRINGVSTITIAITKESGENAIEIADKVIAEIGKLQKSFPPDISMEISKDSTKEMREQLDDIKIRSLFSLVIITIVLLIFLRDIKTPFLIVITISFSLLLTCIFLYFAGQTINIVTLSGIVLALGLLVDNSIVVIENIYNYYKKGYNRLEASYLGVKEVIMPVVASTLTTLVVFIPFLYLTGEKKLYWIPLAVVVSVALVCSLFVAFTFTPTMTNLFLKEFTRNQEKITHDKLEVQDSFYHTFLKILISNKILTTLGILILFYFSFYLFNKHVDKGAIFSWSMPEGIQLSLNMPTGSQIETTDAIIREFGKTIKKTGGYDKFYSYIGDTRASIEIKYTEEDMKTMKPFEMENNLVSKARNFAGPGINIFNPLNQSNSYHSGGTTREFYTNQIKIKGFSFDELKKQALILKNYLLESGKVDDVDINYVGWYSSKDMFNFTIKLDRKKLAQFGISIANLAYFISANISGSYPLKTIIDGTEVPYLVKFSDYQDFSVTDLEDLIYKYGNHFLRIKSIVKIEKEAVLPFIYKENQAYTRTIAFNFKGSSKMAGRFQNKVMDTYQLPAGYSFVKEDRKYMEDDEYDEIYMIIGFSILLVFLVTASLFESLLHPFVVILTIPLGLIGVFFIFFFLDETFNRDAYMGAIILAGISVNNSIILINHINDLRKHGFDILKAIIIGTSQRIRPILMTTATTVIGILPLIIETEKDKNFWYTLSITTVGGMIASTIFVLFFIPVLYALVERLKARTKSVISYLFSA